jgi:hypothetical protein
MAGQGRVHARRNRNDGRLISSHFCCTLPLASDDDGVRIAGSVTDSWN